MGMFDWFKEAVGDKTKKIVDKAKEEGERFDLEASEKFSKLTLFPGSKAEFEEFIGFPCVLIDTGRQNKGLNYATFGGDKFLSSYSREFREEMLSEEIIGLVRVERTAAYGRGDDNAFYGIPVKRAAVEDL